MKKLLMILVGALLFASPLVVFADTPPPQNGGNSSQVGTPPLDGSNNTSQTGVQAPLPQGTNYTPSGSYAVKNPLGNINSFCGLIKALLGAAIQIGIPIAVLFIVFAGFKFVWARGNSEALVSARENFMWTIIGIGIFLGAWLLAMVIAGTINTVSQGVTDQQAISCQ